MRYQNRSTKKFQFDGTKYQNSKNCYDTFKLYVNLFDSLFMKEKKEKYLQVSSVIDQMVITRKINLITP
jgi:hypothetical protein